MLSMYIPKLDYAHFGNTRLALNYYVDVSTRYRSRGPFLEEYHIHMFRETLCTYR